MDSWALLARVVILLAVAAGLGVVLRRLGQNAIVGYLLAGVALGPTGAGLIGSGQQLHAVSELGVALLLFTIGLEFSFARLRQIGRIATWGGLAQVTLTLAAVTAILRAAGMGFNESFVLASAIAMSSTAVVLRVFADNAELDSRHGRAAVGMLLMQDISVVPLLLATDAMSENLSGPEAISHFALKALGMAGAGVVLWLLMRYLAPVLFARAMLSKNRELPVVVAACASLGAAAGAHAVGISPAIGAFAAGMVLSESPFAIQMKADVTPLSAVFIAIFFASVGTIVNVPIGRQVVYVLLAAAAVMILKTIVAAGVAWTFQRSARVALATGIALSQVGEFTFVLADNASRKGMIGAADLEFLVALSLVTLVATPYVMGAAPRLADAISRRRTPPVPQPVEQVAKGGAGNTVIVIGYGPAGQEVVDALQRAGIPVLILEFNPNTAAAFASTLPMQVGDATQLEILEHAGVAGARAVIVTIPDPSASRAIIEQVRRLAPGVPVIARGRYHQYAPMLETAGAVSVIDEEQIVGTEMAQQALRLLTSGSSGA